MSAAKFFHHCIVCNKDLHHPKQLEDHLKKPQHHENILKQQYLEQVQDFQFNFRSGSKYMILDLEGNVKQNNQGMILLEISYLIFTFKDEKFEIVKTFSTLVKAGLISEQPQDMQPVIKFTIFHKHGLPFSKCQEHGITPEEACQQFQKDAEGCKYILAKGRGMEKMFNDGCKLQGEYQTTATGIPVLDLLDIKEMDIKTQNLENYPECGYHMRSPEGQILHCSLAEIHCFYDQVIAFLIKESNQN